MYSVYVTVRATLIRCQTINFTNKDERLGAEEYEKEKAEDITDKMFHFKKFNGKMNITSSTFPINCFK